MVGFFRYLLRQTETRLALVGGALLLLSLPAAWLGLPALVPTALQLAALAVAGYPVARSGLANLFINRTISINLLMTIAAVGAVIIGEMSEAATLIFLFAVAEALEGYTTDRARRVLGELHELTPAQALRLGPEGEVLVPVAALQPGERILVRPGERIPMDGDVLDGHSEADQAPITGESMPVPKAPGDPVFAGSVNGSGALEVRVTRRADDTTLARIIRMVTEAQGRRAESQRFIDRFAASLHPRGGWHRDSGGHSAALAVQPALPQPGQRAWLAVPRPGPAGHRLPLRPGHLRARHGHFGHLRGRAPGRAHQGRRCTWRRWPACAPWPLTRPAPSPAVARP